MDIMDYCIYMSLSLGFFSCTVVVITFIITKDIACSIMSRVVKFKVKNCSFKNII